MELLLCSLRGGLPGAHGGVRLPRFRWPPCRRGRRLRRLCRGPALFADVQHAHVSGVPCGRLERGELRNQHVRRRKRGVDVRLCRQCSVTCGSGEQTREVTCVDSRGAKRDELSCAHRLRPHAVQRCEAAPCPARVRWHVGDWGLVRTRGGAGAAAADCPSEPRRCLSPPVFQELRIRLAEPGGDLLGPGEEPVPHAGVPGPPDAPHGGAVQRSALPPATA